jgi:hypothetical protein
VTFELRPDRIERASEVGIQRMSVQNSQIWYGNHFVEYFGEGIAQRNYAEMWLNESRVGCPLLHRKLWWEFPWVSFRAETFWGIFYSKPRSTTYACYGWKCLGGFATFLVLFGQLFVHIDRLVTQHTPGLNGMPLSAGTLWFLGLFFFLMSCFLTVWSE